MYGQQRGEGPGDLRCHSQRLRQEWARGDIGSDPWGAWFPWTRFSDEGVEEGAETFERREGCVEPERSWRAAPLKEVDGAPGAGGGTAQCSGPARLSVQGRISLPARVCS